MAIRKTSIMDRKIIAALLVLATTNCNALTGYGLCNFGKEKIASITCFGAAKLSQTIVTGDIAVTGPLLADNSQLQAMDVKGVAKLTHSSVKTNTQVTGFLTADHGTFEGDVHITSDHTILNASTVKGSITISSPHIHPTLELHCGSTISGSVTFKGLSGVIQKSRDSVVNGKITNGVVATVESKEECDSDRG
jgi:hypothetical protein